MSHLSKIKTQIKNKSILQKSLEELNILWENKLGTDDLHIYSLDKYFKYNAILKWNDNTYELIADSNTWQEKNMLCLLLEKIQQRYAFHTIISVSKNEGFNNIEHNILRDGSIRIVLEKWSI